MPYSGGCIATPSFQVLLIPWFGWRLRMVIFQFAPFTPLWQVGEWSLSLYDTVWNSWDTIRASFFPWEATWAKILA